jgi:hypothetical protein
MPAAAKLLTDSGTVKATSGQLVGVAFSDSAAGQISVKDGTTEIVSLRLGGAGTVVFCPCMPIAFSSLVVTVDTGTAEEISVVYI